MPDDDLISGFRAFSVQGDQDRAHANLQISRDVNPDDAAKRSALAARWGVSLDTATAQQPLLQGAAQADQDNAALATAPKTAGFLAADPANAAVSHDHVHDLSVFEKLGTDLALVPRGIASGIPAVNQGIWGTIATGSKILGLDGASRYALIKAQESEALAKRVAGSDTGTFLGRMTQGASQSVGVQAPGLLAALLTKNPTFAMGAALAPGVIQQGGSSAQKALEQGKSGLGAALYGGVDAAYEAIFEKIPVGRLLGDLAHGSTLAKTLIHQALTEVPTEIGTTLAQNFNAWVNLNPTKTVNQFLSEQPRAVAETAVQTLLQAGGMATTGHAMNKVVQHFANRDTLATQAQPNAEQFNEVVKSANALPLRERDPAKFHDLASRVTEGTDVYVPAEAVTTYLQTKTPAEQQAFIDSTGIAEQLQAATKDTDIVIPAADYLTHVGPTDAHDALKDDIKIGPAGMSVNEAKDHTENRDQLLAEAAAKALGQDANIAAIEDPKARVQQHVYEQAIAAGRPEAQAREYAAIQAAHYEARAQANQRFPDAWAAYAETNPTMQGPGGTTSPPGVVSFDQSSKLSDVEDLAKSLGAELEVEPRGEDDIMLQWIKRAPRKKGTGAQVMQALIDHADATNKSITLGITDNKGARKLQDYYENFGFERDDPYDDYDRIMTRFPDLERAFNQDYDPGLAFRSALHEAVLKGPNKASPAQWLATLQNTPGVKKEELEWLGLPEFLKAQEDGKAVTKDDVAAFVAANGVRLAETTLGKADEDRIEARAEELADEARQRAVENGDFEPSYYPEEIEDSEGNTVWAVGSEHFDTEEKAQEAADEYNGDAENDWLNNNFSAPDYDDEARREIENNSSAQFEDYKLPGGDNYREVLLTLPTSFHPGNAPTPQNPQLKQDFTASHWDEANVVAHTRLTDRTTPDGKKVLFVEEVQSDWHQKGRDQGYAVPATAEEQAAAQASMTKARDDLGTLFEELRQKYDGFFDKTAQDLQDRVDAAKAEMEAADKAYRDYAKQFERDGYETNWSFHPDVPANAVEKRGALSDTFRKAKERYDTLYRNTQNFFQQKHTAFALDNYPMPDRALALSSILTRSAGVEEAGREERQADYEKLVAARLKLTETHAALTATRGERGIPNAPFKSSWPALMMKRIIRLALDGGYDKVAWTTGEQQADRYDLASATGPIDIERTETPGAYILRMDRRAARTISDNGHGTAVRGDSAVLMNADKIREVFGADLGKRLVDAADNAGTQEGVITRAHDGTVSATQVPMPARLEADDLKVGGEGMKAFYDRNLVNITNDIVKKFGGKVGPVSVDMGREGARSDMTPDEEAEHYRLLEDVAAKRKLYYDTVPPGTEAYTSELRQHEDNWREALSRLGQFERQTRAPVQPGFDITDKMRESYNPTLFQAQRGDVSFSSQGALIRLFKSANASTLIHEGAGHVWLEELARDANHESATPEVRADWQRVRDWWVANVEQAQADIADDTVKARIAADPDYLKKVALSFGEIETDPKVRLEAIRPFHEMFARAAERYVMEGRAPNAELRSPFARFRQWLVGIYKDFTALKVPMTDAMREVFDRLAAVPDAINAAKTATQLEPFFKDPAQAGMTQAEFDGYLRTLQTADDAANDRLLGKVMADVRRKHTAAWKSERDALVAELQAEINETPEMQALSMLESGAARLQRSAVEDILGPDGEASLYRRQRPYVFDEGLHPDDVAEQAGLPSGEALLKALQQMKQMHDQLREAGDKTTVRRAMAETLADGEMLARHGDILNDGTIGDEAIAAINDIRRSEVLMAEVRALVRKAGASTRVWSEQEMQTWAKAQIAKRQLAGIRPHVHSAAEAKAGRDALKALVTDDFKAALDAKFRQLLNTHLYRAAREARDNIERGKTLFDTIAHARNGTISKTRDMDMVETARAILAPYGFGSAKNDADYMQKVKDYDPELWADLESGVQAALQGAKPVDELTYDEFQSLREMVSQLWTMSRHSRQMEIDFKTLEVEDIANDLGARLDDLGGGPPPITGRDATDGERFMRTVSALRAALRRVEHWVTFIDGGSRGAFRTYLWNPVSEAAARYRLAKADHLTKFVEALAPLQASLKRGKIEAPEIGYVFGYRNSGVGKGELLHAILHTGNDSNKRKLLLGRGWATENEDGTLDTSRWDAFVQRMHDQGVLTKADYDFAQHTWDLMEAMKPDAQKAHRAVFGRYFEEVTANEFTTPYGVYKGGYVPAIVDTFFEQEQALKAGQNAIEENSDAGMFPSPARGFTKSRVEYNRPLALDLGLLPQHIDKVLKFTHLTAPVRDVLRLLKERSFSAKLEAFDPVAVPELLLPWLNRAAKQIIEVPSKSDAGRLADRFFRALRSRTGMGIMIGNLSNTLQQFTGWFPALTKVRKRDLLTGLLRYTTNSQRMADDISAMSPYMASRVSTQAHEMAQQLDRLLLDPSKFAKANAFVQGHAYFLQAATQNVVDLVLWNAAFEQAAETQDFEDAVRTADSAIRETQGSLAPEDISRFEVNTAFVRAFTQFYNYFGAQSNLLGTEMGMAVRDKKKLRAFYVYVSVLALPAIISDAIRRTFGSGWEPDDDESYLQMWLDVVFGAQFRYVAGAIPAAGPIAQLAVNKFNKKPYDDTMSVAPSASTLTSVADVPADLWRVATEGKGQKAAVRDAASLMTLLTGMPAFNLAARPAGYLADINEGKVNPTGPVDFARGLMTGTASNASKVAP